MDLRDRLRDLTPPVIWRGASKLRRYGKRLWPSESGQLGFGEEQPPGYYDRTYQEAAHWKEHYTASRYYFLWTVVADRLLRRSIERVLDVGCGPGQVACLLRDIGVREYIGLDFSPARVERARQVCPEYDFYVEDVFETDLLRSHEYECVLMLEFLEHIERDLDALSTVRSGSLVVGTVPNFPAAGHVRHFNAIDEVERRYGKVLKDLVVSSVLADGQNKRYFILEGVR